MKLPTILLALLPACAPLNSTNPLDAAVILTRTPQSARTPSAPSAPVFLPSLDPVSPQPILGGVGAN